MYCGTAVDTDTGESMLVEVCKDYFKYMYPELPLTNVAIGYIMNSGCIASV